MEGKGLVSSKTFAVLGGTISHNILEGTAFTQIEKPEKLHFTVDEFGYLAGFTETGKRSTTKKTLRCFYDLKGASVVEKDKKITIKCKNGQKIILADFSSSADAGAWKEAIQKSIKQADSLSKETFQLSWPQELDPFLPASHVDDVNNPAVAPIDLEGVHLEDSYGAQIRLFELTRQPRVFVLLRHFDCLVSRRSLRNLVNHAKLFEQKGFELTVVGLGGKKEANKLKEEFKLRTIFRDKDLTLYRALSCRRGVRYALNDQTKNNALNALQSSLLFGTAVPDEFFPQLGGLFVFVNETILYEQREQYAGEDLNFEAAVAACKDFNSKTNRDFWSSPKETVLQQRHWDKIVPLDYNERCDKSPFVLDHGFYNYELGAPDVPYDSEMRVDDLEEDNTFYRTIMMEREHYNFLGKKRDDPNPANAFLISYLHLPAEADEFSSKKVLFRSKKGSVRFIIPDSATMSESEILEYILLRQKVISDKSEIETLTIVKITADDIKKDLSKFETISVFKNYKFGLMYIAADQTTEQQILSNQNPSPEFFNFMNLLADRVELKGFTGYRGGLDVLHETTGKESYYTEYSGFEIMFHVAPFLPFNPLDPQQLERKRHIGNDVVVLIFKEGNQKFDPKVIPTQFNHVYIIVEDVKERNAYKISICARKGVVPFAPFLETDALIYKNDPNLRNFFLTKLLNSERASLYADVFTEKFERTRREQLEAIMAGYFDEDKASKLKIVTAKKKTVRIRSKSTKRKNKHQLGNLQDDFLSRATDSQSSAGSFESRDEDFSETASQFSEADSVAPFTASLIVRNKKFPQDFDFMQYHSSMSLSKLSSEIGKVMRQRVGSLEVQGIVLRTEHMALLRDGDTLDAVFKD